LDTKSNAAAASAALTDNSNLDRSLRSSGASVGMSGSKKQKDRLGDHRGGGSEWESIKILLEGD
jgi:hypothetical protein